MGDGFAHEVSLDRNLAWVLSALGVTTKCYLSSYAGGRYKLLMKVPAHEVNGEAAMSEALGRIQKRARELACSGKFAGWRAITFELQFEPGYAQAFRWIHSLETQDELDHLCSEARTRVNSTNPEAASR